jgi:hypothetical protein
MLYADPGSGVLIWQLLIALFFGAAFYFTKIRHWAVSKFRPARATRQQSDETNSQHSSRVE